MPQQMLTRYYDIRCQIDPYPEATSLVVEAVDWDEVLRKYPDAELVAIVGERHHPSAPRPVTTAPVTSIDKSQAVITSHPAVARRRRSLFEPPRCGICGRVRLSRPEYAWRQAQGLAVWRCQHRRPTRQPRRDLAEALFVIFLLAIVALWH
jgi:hypothetical protein